MSIDASSGSRARRLRRERSARAPDSELREEAILDLGVPSEPGLGQPLAPAIARRALALHVDQDRARREPINRLNRFLRAFDISEVQTLHERIQAVFDELQPPEADPMLNFDDRDLVDLAEGSGFTEVHLKLRVDVKPPEPMRWEAYANMAFNPRIPTLTEVMERVLDANERTLYESHLRPLVEEGRGSRRTASAYLWALKA
jgi:hypothetical protein